MLILHHVKQILLLLNQIYGNKTVVQLAIPYNPKLVVFKTCFLSFFAVLCYV